MKGDFLMSNAVCELLNIKYPILQGAMAWISEASLASAVSNAGGLGIIACGSAPAEAIRAEIRKARTLTDKPIGLNIMLLSQYADECAQLACEEHVEAVMTGAGNPGKYIDMFKSCGIKVVPVVPSVAIAKRMEKLGADAIIAEGMESGGHIGKLTTMAMLPQIVDAVKIPVIGAGGIGDGRGMAAAFALGACGVQIGTRFLVAKECVVHDNYKKAILNAKDIDTTVTGQITGHPVRVIKNMLSREYDRLEKEEALKESPDLQKFDELGRGGLRNAVVNGDVVNGSVMSGQIAGLVKKEQTCAEIIAELVAEFNDTRCRLNGGVL